MQAAHAAGVALEDSVLVPEKAEEKRRSPAGLGALAPQVTLSRAARQLSIVISH